MAEHLYGQISKYSDKKKNIENKTIRKLVGFVSFNFADALQTQWAGDFYFTFQTVIAMHFYGLTYLYLRLNYDLGRSFVLPDCYL